MCGFAGFYDKEFSNTEAQETLLKMLDPIINRGPDDRGVFLLDGLGLGHQRLSILDLSPQGHQPMISHSGRYIIVFNGEIYNYKDIKDELELLSQVLWKGHSDTEILLQAIEAFGVSDTLKKLNGMFAFAVWDKEKEELTIARDRFGEKPLYYWLSEGKIYFGSELKCISAANVSKKVISKDSLVKFLKVKYIPSPYTIYEDVYKLNPAYYLQWSPKKGIIEQGEYWSLLDAVNNGKAIKKEILIGEVEEKLLESVKKRMMSDVPLGALLSGGVDSSLVVALMSKLSTDKVKTFSIGFDNEKYNEAKYAKEVADYLGTDHTEYYVTGAEALSVVPELAKIYDEPFADSSQIPTFLVSKLAKTKVTVCLTGDGGDEIFGGYSRYFIAESFWNKAKKIPFRVMLFTALYKTPDFLMNIFSKLVFLFFNKKLKNGLSKERLRQFFYTLSFKNQSDFYEDMISSCTNAEELVLGSKKTSVFSSDLNFEKLGFYQAMMIHDSLNYMPGDILTKVDRASMAVSLEGRIPLLDHELVEMAWKLPIDKKINNGEGKITLKEILYKYVPKSLIDRPKMGFGVPLGDWLRTDLVTWGDNLLKRELLEQQGFFDANKVLNIWNNHKQNKADYSTTLWPILMFQAWHKEHHHE